MSTCRNPKLGQGLTEYVILVILIALALLGVVRAIGWRIEEKYDRGTGKIRFIDATEQTGSKP